MSTVDRAALVALIRAHIPRDVYDDDGHTTATTCTNDDWTGGYFADGEQGPFDDHLADVILAAGWTLGGASA